MQASRANQLGATVTISLGLAHESTPAEPWYSECPVDLFGQASLNQSGELAALIVVKPRLCDTGTRPPKQPALVAFEPFPPLGKVDSHGVGVVLGEERLVAISPQLVAEPLQPRGSRRPAHARGRPRQGRER